MDIAKLTHLLAVAEHHHYGRAAEAIGISQQALSASIARLEEDLGVRLFARGRFGAELTAYGETLARHAALIVGETQLARSEIEAMRGGGRGALGVGIGLGFSTFLVPAAIARFHEKWPDYALKCHVDSTANLYQRLAQGSLDLVISAPAFGLTPDAGIQREALFIQRDVLVGRPSHPLSRKKSIRLDDLSAYTWIASATQAGGWERIQAVFGSHGGIAPTRVIRTDSTDLAISLLSQTDMLCVLAESVLSHPLGEGRLVAFDAPDLTDRRLTYIARRKRGSVTAGADAFIRILMDEARAAGFSTRRG